MVRQNNLAGACLWIKPVDLIADRKQRERGREGPGTGYNSQGHIHKGLLHPGKPYRINIPEPLEIEPPAKDQAFHTCLYSRHFIFKP
jgi:hypothetical protein